MELLLKDIAGYEGRYSISNDGRVWSHVQMGKWLTPITDKGGYLHYRLTKGGVTKNHSSHRLTAKAFVKTSDPTLEVNHKDCDKKNTWYSNFEWVTRVDNIQHAFKNGRYNRKGTHNSRSKVTNEDVLAIRKTYSEGLTTTYELAEQYSVDPSTVQKIVRRKTWKHI